MMFVVFCMMFFVLLIIFEVYCKFQVEIDVFFKEYDFEEVISYIDIKEFKYLWVVIYEMMCIWFNGVGLSFSK